MTRRVVWVGLFLATLTLLLGIWFTTHFEQVPYQRWESPGAEARRNPYLALERFLLRMGRPLQQLRDANALDAPPPGGVLILDAGRGRHMTPARVDALLRWVEQGGYLLVAPEGIGSPDLLLTRLGVRWNTPKQDPVEESDEETSTDSAAPPLVTTPATPSPRLLKQDIDDGIELVVPGHPPMHIHADYRSLRSARSPTWRAAAAQGGDRILHFQRGRGHVTVISNLGQILQNYQIGKYDHADVLWTLLDTYQPGGSVRLVRRLATQGLLEWLVAHAWAALLALATLIGLWLWQVMPRFGVIATAPVADRRALGEHLSAIGRYVWRAGGLEHWTTLARRHFQQRLAWLQPALAALPSTEQADALARLVDAGSHGRRELAHALHGPVLTPLDFTHMMRTLRNLEHALQQGVAVTPPDSSA